MADKVKIHNVDGSIHELSSIDARDAVKRHPNEWSTQPFAQEVVTTAQQKAADDTAAKVAQQKS